MKKMELEEIVLQFIGAANRFDTSAVLELFAPNAVINDVSVGVKFEHTAGIKKYFITFFIGYHTTTRLISLEQAGKCKTIAKVDFTGDFGHEIGVLEIYINPVGLITHINADLD